MINQFTQEPLIKHFSGILTLKKWSENENFIESAAVKLCNALELTIVNKFGHNFTNHGQTLIYILSQSHLAIHTWPEYKTIHIDLVVGKEIKKEDFETELKKLFGGTDLLSFSSEEHNI